MCYLYSYKVHVIKCIIQIQVCYSQVRFVIDTESESKYHLFHNDRIHIPFKTESQVPSTDNSRNLNLPRRHLRHRLRERNAQHPILHRRPNLILLNSPTTDISTKPQQIKEAHHPP